MINIYADDAIYLQILETPNEARKAVGLEPLEDVQSAELSESRREHYEPLICSRCGGQIDRETMKCLYCLTEYRSIYKTEDMEFLPKAQWEKENPAVKQIIDKTHKNN